MKKMKLLQLLAASMLLLNLGCNNSTTSTETKKDTTTKVTTDSTRSKDSVSSNPDAPSEPH